MTLRSAQWYGGQDRNAYIHRAWMRRGVPGDAFTGRPQIAIANTASDLTPCNAHLDEVAASVRNGVYEAGGIPLDLPVVSLGETNVRPTAMLWRNMAAMATEEMLRANPVDGVVLLGGCDKTIPSLLMAAASVDLPAIVVPGGPMLNGTFRGGLLGCGTGVWQLSEEVRAGTLSQEQFTRSESAMIRSRGHCNTMGTASTMALVAEALGTVLPGVAGTPAPDSRLLEAAHRTGRLAVDMVGADRRPGTFLTRASFHNAIVALAAIGGSTNAVVHLLAIAGRLGIDLTLDDFDRVGSRVPVLVDLQPAGRFLMEDLHRAGGLLAVLREVRDLLDPDALTVTGEPLVDHLDDATVWDAEVIRPRSEPLVAEGGIAVLRGNLAPDGALVKPAAASPQLLRHRGRAVVFDSIEDFRARIDDPDLDVDADSVLVLRGCGPKGYPGMPEVANMPLPKKLLEQGVRDMVRVCDGRMSGTAYGTVVLHVAPEAAAGGPLSLVRTGDFITLDVGARRIDVDVPDDELARREPSRATVDGFAAPRRGWERLYVDHVLQADTGADLDFLIGSSGSEVSRESH
ncbi:IlvD/Edd family dehydratase [Streptomyces europaeiscabiei]|uniref:IlvD/Edd family dehydratase n=1 Tax=Streptomyces europaeiscabiei TaxID=146819 RepID=UPI0007660DC6|nr:IlvD/Edd family dehydratase [Streptomyces europaeiscabiei]MDX2528990.1 dihydroxy-acid dehydratase [Streptomyces europaeiscabiei]MDX2769622.1 dihydroxy-acid dehydratase [Streptomyces europaeiscabiei]MDX3671375.1 dihydroxy-acid dehydratase [Streptomyces europaeiscabiei]MDX3714485.1 dihydroxy-acid dehydratase [Streptomyces europaeiscabiei]MDX3781702.1 dihydroxy-acid dehydratase [Streptomyces europaeiscabiei]